MGEAMQKVGNIFGKVVNLMPIAIKWIRARLERGEKPEAIRRDIQSRIDDIKANREKRDDQFREKFGRDIGDGDDA